MARGLKKCSTCMAYDDGECRGNPPQVIAGSVRRGRWPHVEPDDYCQLWKPEPGSEADEEYWDSLRRKIRERKKKSRLWPWGG